MKFIGRKTELSQLNAMHETPCWSDCANNKKISSKSILPRLDGLVPNHCGLNMYQGKMPQSVRDRYMKMKAQPEHPATIDALIDNFDRALFHSDQVI